MSWGEVCNVRPSCGRKLRPGLLSLLVAICGAGAIWGASGVLAPAAQAAFGVEKWEAATCKERACNAEGKDPSAEFYTQAAGHPNFGITDFAFNYTTTTNALLEKVEIPDGHVRDVRVDLPPGLAVNPEAVPQCPETLIKELKCPESTQVGVDEATGTAEVSAGPLPLVTKTVTEEFPVFNVTRKPGEPARFGVEVESPTLKLAEELGGKKLQSAIYLEGGISWHVEAETAESSGVATGDYHEFFKIQEIPTQPELIESKLIFWGVPHEQEPSDASDNAFITMPSAHSDCTQPQSTYLHAASYENPSDFLAYSFETILDNKQPVTATGCETLAFTPSFSLTPETTALDQPDGLTAHLHVPQNISEPSKTSSPDLRSAEVTLPAGLTLNASAAHGLEGCTDAEIGLATDSKIECPVGSEIGTVAVNAPGIPAGSLTGTIYLGSPEPTQGPESGKEFRIFLAAESTQYGVGVRLEGQVKANEHTGQLTATFEDTPEVPFEDFTLSFKTGPRAPLANPLSCGPADPVALLTPYSGQPATAATITSFAIEGSSSNGACPAPLPFALTQSSPSQDPATAGSYSPFGLDFARSDGQQYLSSVQTTLPPGLLGAIPSVPLCAEPQAAAGTCSTASEIGTVTVAAGAGAEPYTFTGRVYLTGPYDGAPYGMSIVVPAVAGPYDFGNVVTRAKIAVGEYSGRVTVTATLPRIEDGVPLRLTNIDLTVNRPNFLFNPTNCGALVTESALAGFTTLDAEGSPITAAQALSTPFQVGECAKLPFKPALSAYSGAKTSKASGASLEVKVTQAAHQANIRQLLLTLPKQLPARSSTLKKACLAETFETGPAPGECTEAARVGTVTVSTPVLPGTLSGPAYLVSHGGAAFPDLDLIVRGDGIQVVLVGHTNISSAGITTSKFETLPDVPISSVTVSLPTGPQSILAANGNLCTSTLTAPTTIVAQSGAPITQQTRIAVRNCPVEILKHRTSHDRALLTILTPAAGRLTVSGPGLLALTRRVSKVGKVTLKVPLKAAARSKLRSHRKLRVRVRVKFLPKAGSGKSKASTTVTFHL
jgi:hypothetical protein